MEQTEFRNFYTIVDGYKKVINNTKEYRAMWGNGTKEMITKVLEQLNTATKLDGGRLPPKNIAIRTIDT